MDGTTGERHVLICNRTAAEVRKRPPFTVLPAVTAHSDSTRPARPPSAPPRGVAAVLFSVALLLQVSMEWASPAKIAVMDDTSIRDCPPDPWRVGEIDSNSEVVLGPFSVAHLTNFSQ